MAPATPHFFQGRVKSDWQAGSPYRYVNPDGGIDIAGEVVEADPPRRLLTKFQTLWLSSEAPEREHPSIVTREIAPMGAACKLSLTHEGLDPRGELAASVSSGWAQILSGLKTLIETGEPLVVGQ